MQKEVKLDLNIDSDFFVEMMEQIELGLNRNIHSTTLEKFKWNVTVQRR